LEHRAAKPARLVDYDANPDYLTDIFGPLVVVAAIYFDTLVRMPVPSRSTTDLLLQFRRVLCGPRRAEHSCSPGALISI
jgi:hypothetical protein